jgi:hypothetical protein
MAASESFEDFQSLHLQEVRRRADEAETRPAVSGTADLPFTKAAWRRLYRDMRRGKASRVAELKRHEVEDHASTLGYGYFRIRVTGADAFMPLLR